MPNTHELYPRTEFDIEGRLKPEPTGSARPQPGDMPESPPKPLAEEQTVPKTDTQES